MKCKKCGTEMQIISNNVIKTKHRGLIGWLLWIILAICTCGLILIVPLLTNSKVKGKTINYWYCPRCSKKYKIY